MSGRSLLLIKPNAVAHRHVGQIISILENAGFRLTALKEFRFTPAEAREFYAQHRGKEFFDRLVKFMCSDFTIAAVVAKDNAVEELRRLIGAVDPAERERGTIRDLFAEGITENAVHASDSEANAEREIALLFTPKIDLSI